MTPDQLPSVLPQTVARRWEECVSFCNKRAVGAMGHGERSQEWIVTVLSAFQLLLLVQEKETRAGKAVGRPRHVPWSAG